MIIQKAAARWGEKGRLESRPENEASQLEAAV